MACLLAADLSRYLGKADASRKNCSKQAPDAPREADQPAERLELVACAEHFGAFTTWVSEVDPYLTDGSHPVGLEGEPLPEGLAVVVVLGFTCERPEGAQPLLVFLGEAPVDAPETYAREDAVLEFVHTVGVVWDPRVRDTFATLALDRSEAGGYALDVPAVVARDPRVDGSDMYDCSQSNPCAWRSGR